MVKQIVEVTVKGINNLATTHPQLVREYSDKNDKSIDEHKVKDKVWWKCSTCNYEWQAVIDNRKRGRGCPECKKIKMAKVQSTPKQGESLADLYPDLAKEWDFKKNELKPTEVATGSGRKVWWLCKEGHSWQAEVHNRTNGQGCPYCANKKDTR